MKLLIKNDCGWTYDESDKSIKWEGDEDSSHNHVEWLFYIVSHVLEPDYLLNGSILCEIIGFENEIHETIEINNNNIKVYKTNIEYIDDERIVTIDKNFETTQNHHKKIFINYHTDSDDEKNIVSDGEPEFVLKDNFEILDD
jgi:hypothetical protein